MEGCVVRFFECISIVAGRSKLGGNRVSGPVVSCGSFEGDSGVNRESEGSGEVDPLVISEVPGVGIKLGISDGEVPGIIQGSEYRSKLGVMQYQGRFYQLATFSLLEMATLRMVVKIFRSQHVYIHCYKKVGL